MEMVKDDNALTVTLQIQLPFLLRDPSVTVIKQLAETVLNQDVKQETGAIVRKNIPGCCMANVPDCLQADCLSSIHISAALLL